ncbi:MAG: hypothetical protein OEV89_04895 [Desulfobulbaceae bacterium]|nr:hypothetical protein [Desulfobulbaceae bacterium]HIJ90086.1 hypothetical protein [Deltaproteobacteria bacterium]
MNSKERLEKLQTLLNMPATEHGFESQQACIKWVNEVGKLLSYKTYFYEQYIPQSNILNSRWISQKLGASALNKVITIANMAVADLERVIELPTADPEPKSTAQPSDKEAPDSKEKKSISIINIGEGLIIGFLMLCLVWALFHYFGINFGIN